ncbi:MAG: OmpH family outer membrane protein [Candidatus Zhuqueibacterota bacterium]
MMLRHVVKASLVVLLVLLVAAPGFGQKLKVGFVHSQKLLTTFQDAIDANKKLEEIDRQWKTEGLEMQKEMERLNEQFETQSLLLSDAKKKEKQQEIQTLYMKIQQFQQDKYNPQNGEIYRKQAELMQPVYDKINEVIKKIGDDEKYDMILDTASGIFLHVSSAVTDLTEQVISELNKGQNVPKETTENK